MLLSGLFLGQYVYGQASSIKINEFLIEPTPQIVELLNTGSEIINLSNWFIDDNGGTTYFTIPEGTQLYPNACMSFSGSFNLNRTSADSVRLFDATAPPTSGSAHLIDVFDYKSSSGSGITYQRIPDGSDAWATGTATLNQYNLTGQSCVYIPTPSPTPTATPIPTVTPVAAESPSISLSVTPFFLPTSIPPPTSPPTSTPTPMLTAAPSPTPTPTPDIRAVYLSEVYPYPVTDEHEWIEIYNDNAFSVTLQDWKIDDVANGGSSPKKFSLTIPGYSFGLIDLSSSMFNNDADSVRLLDAVDRVVESFAYDGVEKSKSIARESFIGTSFCLQNPTRGYSNTGCISTEPSATPTPTPTPIITLTPAPSLTKDQNSQNHRDDVLGVSHTRASHLLARYTVPREKNDRTEGALSKLSTDQSEGTKKKKHAFIYASSVTLITSFLTAGWIFIRIIL